MDDYCSFEAGRLNQPFFLQLTNFGELAKHGPTMYTTLAPKTLRGKNHVFPLQRDLYPPLAPLNVRKLHWLPMDRKRSPHFSNKWFRITIKQRPPCYVVKLAFGAFNHVMSTNIFLTWFNSPDRWVSLTKYHTRGCAVAKFEPPVHR